MTVEKLGEISWQEGLMLFKCHLFRIMTGPLVLLLRYYLTNPVDFLYYDYQVKTSLIRKLALAAARTR